MRGQVRRGLVPPEPDLFPPFPFPLFGCRCPAPSLPLPQPTRLLLPRSSLASFGSSLCGVCDPSLPPFAAASRRCPRLPFPTFPSLLPVPHLPSDLRFFGAFSPLPFPVHLSPARSHSFLPFRLFLRYFPCFLRLFLSPGILSFSFAHCVAK